MPTHMGTIHEIVIDVGKIREMGIATRVGIAKRELSDLLGMYNAPKGQKSEIGERCCYTFSFKLSKHQLVKDALHIKCAPDKDKVEQMLGFVEYTISDIIHYS